MTIELYPLDRYAKHSPQVYQSQSDAIADILNTPIMWKEIKIDALNIDSTLFSKLAKKAERIEFYRIADMKITGKELNGNTVLKELLMRTVEMNKPIAQTGKNNKPITSLGKVKVLEYYSNKVDFTDKSLNEIETLITNDADLICQTLRTSTNIKKVIYKGKCQDD